MTRNHYLSPSEVAQIDQAYEAAVRDLDVLIAGMGPLLREAVEADGVAVAVARYTGRLSMESPQYLAALAALASARLAGVDLRGVHGGD